VISQLAKSPNGHLVPIEDGLRAYAPNPLPRHIDLDSNLIYRLDEASRAVATLAGVGETIPNPHLLIQPFMRREAVLSSRIEGTQTSLSDLLLYEASRRPSGDVLEVHNYVRALEDGLRLLDDLPICLRLVNQTHSILLSDVRGQNKRPGEIRNAQVWIGPEGTPLQDARYVPPPPGMVLDLMLDWERFANEELEMPPLVQCALLHYQFEAIHPYLDGNGRMGRLLIVLFLCAKGVMRTPLLYLSAYFESDRQKYYDELFNVSVTGDWGRWLRYFLEGMTEQAKDALVRTRQVRELQEEYRALLQENRESGNVLRLVDVLFAQPYISAPLAADFLDITYQGVRKILGRLVTLRILKVIPDTWPRLYVAERLLEIIQAPTAGGT
jgi:Fic family protein